jgi:hypothetical protein
MDEHRRPTAENSGITAGGNVSIDSGGGNVAGRDLFTIAQLKLYTGGGAREEDDRRRDAQHRARLVTRVCRDYEQRLTQALDNVVRLELALEETPAAVYHQLDIAAPRELAPRPLPASTDVTAIYRETGGRNGSGLLVLGDPGGGKTTAVLELARTIAIGAAADDDDPIPVYVPLSSWAGGREPPGKRLAEWLAHEVHDLYQLPLDTAQRWVAVDRLLPVLDGLDEIGGLDQRADCLMAINAFVKEHAVPVVLACRQLDYFQLVDAGYRASELGTAICIAALDPEDVLDYLEHAGSPLAGVRAAVERDPELLEMCRSPLLLSILTLTYSTATLEQVAAATGPGHQRSRLFTDYVATRFDRAERARTAGAPAVDRQRSSAWLSVLAANMERHGHTVFLLDRLQYDWLPGRLGRALARLAPTLIFFPLYLSLAALMGTVTMDFVLVGCLTALGLALASSLTEIRLVERMTWSWRAVLAGMRGTIVLTVIFTLVFTGLVRLLIGPDELWWAYSVLIALSGFVGGVFNDGFQTALGSVTREPNEGLRNSLSHGLRSGLIGGVLLGVLAGAVLAAIVGPGAGLRVGVFLGLTTIVFLGVVKGFGAAIQHLIVRLLLWRAGRAPLGYAAWLETMVRLRLLYRMGGGYVFIHRFLQEFFAEGDASASRARSIPDQSPGAGA